MRYVSGMLNDMSTSTALAGWVADDSTFGARLALIRQRMGWGNVKEAALACGVPVASWRNWERDGRLPRDLIQVSGQISRTTGCDQAWLAGLPTGATGTQGANSEIACSRKTAGHGLELVTWADDLADELTGGASGRRHLTLVPVATDGAGDEDADAELGAVTADLAVRRSA